MEFKGTNGKWKASIIDVYNYGVYENDIETKDGKIIATTWGETQEEAEYNAKLIAAAPELLHALRVIASNSNDHAMIRIAIKAIQQATEL